MSYYTLVPNVRNRDGANYVSNFCDKKWQVLHEDNWLELNVTNTRVRDKNNTQWIELCDGHYIETTGSNVKESDCSCYSKSFDESLNRTINSFAGHEQVEFVLYGKLASVYDDTNIVYIAYYIQHDDQFQLKLYCLNKEYSTIDNVTIDIVSTQTKINLFMLNGMLVIQSPTILYQIDAQYVINANFEFSSMPDYYTRYTDTSLTVRDGTLSYGAVDRSIEPLAQYSTLIFENAACVSTFVNHKLTIYALDTMHKMGSSISDAHSVFFFERLHGLHTVEGYDNYIKIKGTE